MKLSFLKILLTLTAIVLILSNLTTVQLQISNPNGTVLYAHLVHNAFYARWPNIFDQWVQLIFTVGMLLTLRYVYAYSVLESVFLSTLALFSLLIFFGNDRLVWDFIAWLPLLIFAAFFSLPRSDFPPYKQLLFLLALLLISYLTGRSAQILAPLVYLVALTTCYFSSPSGQRIKITPLMLLMAFPCIFAWWSAPTPIYPNYPAFAQVVPDDGIPGIIRPPIGIDTPIPFIDRLNLKLVYRLPVFILFVSVFIGFLNDYRLRHKICPAFLTVFIVFTLALVDSCPRDEYATLFPLETLSRLVSGFWLFPLLPMALAFGLVILSVRSPPTLVAATILCWITYSNFRNLPLLNIREAEKFIHSLDELHIDPVKLVSPSLAVARYYGAHAFTMEKMIFHNPAKLPREYQPLVIDIQQPKQDLLPLLIDQDKATRWISPKIQHPGQVLKLEFTQNVRLQGMLLSPGDYTTDFPRGLHVESCDGRQVFGSYPHWLGSVKRNKADYPYFVRQSSVSIGFQKTIETQCLKITQSNKDPYFHWSIAELRLALENFGNGKAIDYQLASEEEDE